MHTVPTPAAVVAIRMLAALEVVDRAQARAILADWCRPSPRLAPADIRAILAEFPATLGADPPQASPDREDPESGLPVPPHVEGYGISGRNPGGTDGR